MEALCRTQFHSLWVFLDIINDVFRDNDDKEFPFHKSSEFEKPPINYVWLFHI